MEHLFEQLYDILDRNQHDCRKFMEIIKPKIEAAGDEHERLYWHHIYEEEEQRFDRLSDLLPKLTQYLEDNNSFSSHDLEFIHTLQDISLEKFGIHNFEEHLDLGLYWYKDTEQGLQLQDLRDATSADYQRIKDILNELNHRFDGVAMKSGATPTDDKEGSQDSLKALKYTSFVKEEGSHSSKPESISTVKKRLTVGSLKNK